VSSYVSRITVPVEFAGGGARHHADGSAVGPDPEAVVLGGDGDELARVDQADLDLLVQQGRLHAIPIRGRRGLEL
jgi:hypothetical protein